MSRSNLAAALVIAILGCTIFGSSVSAQTFRRFSGSMHGGELQFVSDSSPCSDGYANRCFHAPCQCTHLVGTITNGTTGKGSFLIEVTQEQGVQSSGYTHCFPIYLYATIDGAKDTMVWEGNGSECASLNDSKQPEFIRGGFGIKSSDTVSGGGGSFKGTIDFTPGNRKVTFAFLG